ncbi:MAG TPA: ABC-F family ATP-binding cassette domain-containing protein [Chitinophagales bacterium]|nr:ABC-F family ATP-binding cassette domain-containing protein [Chitinophagales bacterium]
MIFISNLTKVFAGEEIFSGISFLINPKDRIGLVGKNGAGKSTLMNLIAGNMQPDGGSVEISQNRKVGYLAQELKASSGKTVFEEAMTAFGEVLEVEKEIRRIEHELESRSDYNSDEYHRLLDDLAHNHDLFNHLDGNNRQSNLEKVLKGLGFEASDFHRPLAEFSGGWQMRVELAKLLLRMPDLLLLDEPTNHLDIESILWLEDFLKNYPGAVMLVSHDKMFLDNVTTRTIEIVLGKIYDYKAPYTKYLVLRQERIQQQENAFKNQQREIAQAERFIERFRYKNTKARQVQSRIKMLDKMERIEIDQTDTSRLSIRFPPAPRAGEIALEVKNVSKRYGSHLVFKDVNLTLERGDKAAFVGRNGEGKSTLVKIISGREKYEGSVRPGYNVKLGYYAQIQDGTLDENLTVLQTIEQDATGEWRNITRIRGLLGAFLFGEDAIDKKVKVLSGGEKSRLALAKLLLKPINLLILDEPTNHLDMSAKEVLKQALLKYDGTMIVVSHDRDFLQGLTNKTYEFSHQRVKEHLGGINDFLRNHKVETFREFEAMKGNPQKAKGNGHEENGKQQEVPGDSHDRALSNKEKYERKKQHEKELRKLQSKVAKYEQEIAMLETALFHLSQKMQQPDFYRDATISRKVIDEHDGLKKKLDGLVAEWERAAGELEKLSLAPPQT